MHLISWNVGRANGRKKIQAIRNLRSKHHMDVVFIQETKISKHEEKVVAAMWGREKLCWRSVDAVGSSGGLLSIWDPHFKHFISEVKGRGFILVHGTIMLNQHAVLINFVNVYAPRSEKEKLKLCEDVVALKTSNEGEWVIGGDFNSVLVEEERRRSFFNERDANQFQEFTQSMGGMDLLIRGMRFTWGNIRGREKLGCQTVSNT
ncbi:unnamed protein product [Rhodiola kirilowii]